MDRTSRIGVLVCLVLLFILWFYSVPPASKLRPPAAALASANPAASGATTNTVASPPAAVAPAATAAPPAAPEQISVLENDYIKVTFTSNGGAIKHIELKKHQEGDHTNVLLNEQAHSNIGQLFGWPGVDTLAFQAQANGSQIAYTATLPNGVKWERAYTLGKDYVITVQDQLSNPGGDSQTLPSFGLSVGRAEPLRVSGHYQRNSNLYLGSGWLTSKFHLTTVNDFNPSSFFGLNPRPTRSEFTSHGADASLFERLGLVNPQPDLPVHWLGAENQFFTVLLTPGDDRTLAYAEFQCFNTRDAEGRVPVDAEPDIEAAAWFPAVKLAANQAVKLNYTLYAGPKEYGRLSALGRQQGEMMNYGLFSLLIVPMLGLLHFFHSGLGNYGVAIILLTLCIKGITWPLQSFANRSGKRMQALAPKIKELQAKYKEQPEKLSSETFGLYREYGVNPMGGCVPALIQMPVFFSLYFMLQNAVELRREQFLWVHDLTQPDTVARFTALGFHLALNPLPLMVTGLTMVMMRLTPQMGDPQQQKIAQFMPLVFLFIFYNFAAALSLYYVINNCVSIVQIYRNLRKPLPELKRVPKKKGPPS